MDKETQKKLICLAQLGLIVWYLYKKLKMDIVTPAQGNRRGKKGKKA